MRTHSEYVKAVTEIVADQIGLEPGDITPEAKLRELGADSLDDIELIMDFEDEFDMEIPDEEAEKLVTANAIVEYLEERLGVDEG